MNTTIVIRTKLPSICNLATKLDQNKDDMHHHELMIEIKEKIQKPLNHKPSLKSLKKKKTSMDITKKKMNR
jgi:hypothetical protein